MSDSGATIKGISFTINANTTKAENALARLRDSLKLTAEAADGVSRSFNSLDATNIGNAAKIAKTAQATKKAADEQKKANEEVAKSVQETEKVQADSAMAEKIRAEEQAMRMQKIGEHARSAAKDVKKAYSEIEEPQKKRFSWDSEEGKAKLAEMDSMLRNRASVRLKQMAEQEKVRKMQEEETSKIREAQEAAREAAEELQRRRDQMAMASGAFFKDVLTGLTIGSGNNLFTKGLDTIGANVRSLSDSFSTLGSRLPEGKFKEFANTVGYLTGILGNAVRYSASFLDGFIKVGGGLLDRLTTHLFGNIRRIVSSLDYLKGMIARRAVTMAIRGAIRMITAGLNEGIQNLYAWSYAVDQTFYNTMNTLSTAGLYLKNSLAAALAPVLNAITPYIDAIINQFVALVNTINQVLALLTGQSYWTKAVKVQTKFNNDVGGSMGKTGKAAKAAKKEIDLYLASFDELHVMNKPSSSGSGGGGGAGGGGKAGGISPMSMFVNEPFDNTLKSLIESGDWRGIGALLAEKMNVVTGELDKWFKHKFEPWAIKFGTNLGNFINGFVAHYNWSLLGKTIGDGIMGVIRGLNSYLDTTDFVAVGNGLGDVLRSLFDTINWQELGHYFAGKLNVTIDIAYGFFKSLFRGDSARKYGNYIATALTTAFNDIHWDELAEALETGFNGAMETFSQFIGSEKMWSKLETGLTTLFDGIKKMDVHKLATNISTAITKALDTLDKSGGWEAIGSTIGKFLGGIDWSGIVKGALVGSWKMITSGVRAFFSSSEGTDLMVAIGGIIGGAAIKAGLLKIVLQGVLKSATVSAAGGAGLGLSGIAGAEGLAGFSLKNWILGKLGLEGITGLQWITTGAGITIAFPILLATALTMSINDKGAKSTASLVQWAKDQGFDVQNATPDQWTYWAKLKVKMEVLPEVIDTSPKKQNTIGSGKGTGMQKGGGTSHVSYRVQGADVGNIASQVTKSTSTTVNVTAKATALQDAIPTGAKIISNMTGDLKQKIESFNHRTDPMTSLQNSKNETYKHTTDPMNAQIKTKTEGFAHTTNDMTAKLAKKAESFAKTTGDMTANLAKRLIGFNTTVDMTAKITALKATQDVKNALSNMGVNIAGMFRAGGGMYLNGKWSDIQKYAGGGDPIGGQLFIAREAGPELVGSLNGRGTAVMNNDQIVASVADGVARAVASVMGSAGSNNGSQPVDVYVDGERLFRLMVNRNNSEVAKTGASPLLV